MDFTLVCRSFLCWQRSSAGMMWRFFTNFGWSASQSMLPSPAMLHCNHWGLYSSITASCKSCFDFYVATPSCIRPSCSHLQIINLCKIRFDLDIFICFSLKLSVDRQGQTACMDAINHIVSVVDNGCALWLPLVHGIATKKGFSQLTVTSIQIIVRYQNSPSLPSTYLIIRCWRERISGRSMRRSSFGNVFSLFLNR